jgi:hypothetical protein
MNVLTKWIFLVLFSSLWGLNDAFGSSGSYFKNGGYFEGFLDRKKGYA